MANAYTKFMDERSQDPQGKNVSIAEMASAYSKFMDDAEQRANKLFLKEQQRELLSTLELNMEEELEIHEDTTLRSGEIEEPKEEKGVEEVEEVVKELDELVEIEVELASSKNDENDIEIETILKMTPWAYVQEELPSEDVSYILEMEEVIMPLIEYKKASIVKIVITLFEDYVLKLLIEHNYQFLGTNGGEYHHSLRSLMSQAGL